MINWSTMTNEQMYNKIVSCICSCCVFDSRCPILTEQKMNLKKKLSGAEKIEKKNLKLKKIKKIKNIKQLINT